MLARVLVQLAVWLVLVVTALAGVFVAGEAMDDPGGVAGLGLVATWLLPLVALTWLAWTAPVRLLPWLAALSAAPLLVALWAAVDRDGFSRSMDAVGPVPAVLVLVLGAPVVLIGRVRPLVAAGLGLLVTVPPLLLLVGAGSGPVVSSTVMSAPLMLASVLLLVAGLLRRSSSRQQPRAEGHGHITSVA